MDYPAMSLPTSCFSRQAPPVGDYDVPHAIEWLTGNGSNYRATNALLARQLTCERALREFETPNRIEWPKLSSRH